MSSGFCCVFGLHALPHVGAAPLPVVGPFVLAAAAFVLLLIVESRAEAPLVDLSFFARRGFVMGVAIGSLSMFSIMNQHGNVLEHQTRVELRHRQQCNGRG